jgi:hypothetical protein
MPTLHAYASDMTKPNALVVSSEAAWLNNWKPMKAGLFGTPKLQLAVLPAPITVSVTSRLTRRRQPGAPNAARSSGNGSTPPVTVLLTPTTMTATPACRLVSVVFSVPPIVGMDQESFRALMNAYRTNERENQVMRSIAQRFSNEDIAALAAYFESVKPK